VLVMLGEEAGEEAQIRLAAERIDVRHVNDEASVAFLCQRQLLR